MVKLNTQVQNIDIFNPLELPGRGLKLLNLKSQKIQDGQWCPPFSHLLMDRLNLQLVESKLEFYLLKIVFQSIAFSKCEFRIYWVEVILKFTI